MAEYERELRALDAAEAGRPGDDPLARRLHQTLAAVAAFAPGRRGACPTREELVGYFDHALPAAAGAAVEAHVAACPFCAADLADLRALAVPPLFEAVILAAASGLKLVSHTFAASAAPVAEPARGPAASALELGARGDELDLVMRVEAASPRAADLRLQLRDESGPITRARVNLLRDDALLESRLANSAGEVVFSNVGHGDYSVAVLPPSGDEIARVTLSLTPESGGPS